MSLFIVLFTILNLLYVLYNIGYVFAFSKRLTSGFTHLKYSLVISINYLLRQVLFMADDVTKIRRLKVEHRNEYVTGRNFFIFRLINVFVLFYIIIELFLSNNFESRFIFIPTVLVGLFLLQYMIYHIVNVEDEPYKNIFIVTTIIQYSLFISYLIIQPELVQYWPELFVIQIYNIFLIVVSILNYLLITLITFRILFQKNLFNGSKKLLVNILSFMTIWLTNILAGAIIYDSIIAIDTNYVNSISNGFGFLTIYYGAVREGFSLIAGVTSNMNILDLAKTIIPIPNLIIFFVLFGRLIDLVVNAEKRVQYKSKEVEYHKTKAENYHETYFIN